MLVQFSDNCLSFDWIKISFGLFLLQHDSDYLGIIAAEKGSSKAKQLASQLILLLQVFPKSLK